MTSTSSFRRQCGVLSTVQRGVFGDYAAEMIFFLFKVAEAMLGPTIKLYIYEGICLQELNSHHRCKYLDRYPEYETLVQSKSANYLMYYKILLNLPAVLLVLLCGAWSDKSGRKLPVMLTCFGGIISVLLYMASSQIGGGKGPYLPVILIGAGIRGFCGRTAIMTMACHSYVTDISTKATRTRKLAHLVAMSHFGYLTGCTIAGCLLDTTGFVVVFCVVVAIQAVCFLVASVCMRDTVVVKVDDPELKNNNNNDSVTESGEQAKDDQAKEPQRICCDVDQLRACLVVIMKPRRGKVRCYIIILLLASIIQQTCKSGETDITMLFVERAPLFWVGSLYSYLLGLDYACLGVMSFFVLPILVRYCQATDAALAIVGIMFKISRTLMLAFSDQTWMVFVAVAIGSPHAFTITSVKSMISKLVDEDEIGKTFSIISSLETVSNLLGSVLFNNVYSVTLSLWPGFSYALEAGLYVILLIVMPMLLCGAEKECNNQLSQSSSDDPSETYGSIDPAPSSTTYGSVDSTDALVGRHSPEVAIPPRVRVVERQFSYRSDIVYSYDFESSGCVNPDT